MGSQTRKKTAGRARSRRKRSGGRRFSLVRLAVALSLLGFFLFTLGTVGYVIFFRTVLA